MCIILTYSLVERHRTGHKSTGCWGAPCHNKNQMYFYIVRIWIRARVKNCLAMFIYFRWLSNFNFKKNKIKFVLGLRIFLLKLLYFIQLSALIKLNKEENITNSLIDFNSLKKGCNDTWVNNFWRWTILRKKWSHPLTLWKLS